MTTSNTKLNQNQKQLRKQLLQNLKDANGYVLTYSGLGVTLVVLPEFEGSRMVLVSISLASPKEKKFRRKVGEFVALERMFTMNEFIKVSRDINMDDLVDVLAP